MKFTYETEEMPLMNGYFVFRWDAKIDPEELGEITLEQMQEELRICVNEQLKTNRMGSIRIW